MADFASMQYSLLRLDAALSDHPAGVYLLRIVESYFDSKLDHINFQQLVLRRPDFERSSWVIRPLVFWRSGQT